ncbi:MAG: hypothetical protein AVO39_02465 [delta proteobacterium MLS_D]|jgi:hypothetical protein|nr:MAG: hypothetical protein AVO39_02465 [delta proteobacterium MLS_D]
MTVTRHIDPLVSFEMLLLELFQGVFQNDAARRQFGFSQISQVTTSDGLLSWYLWFSEKPGAYSLTVTEGQVVSESDNVSGNQQDTDILEGRLAIRYFPDMEDEMFDSLSCYEQIFRMGPSFDANGTPSFEGGRTMHDGFFVAGYMNILIHSSKADVDFFCSAPDRWRDYRLDGLTLTNDKGESRRVLSPGAVDRDFPGWDISFFILDKIISSFCFVFGQAPRCVGAASRPFVHYEIDSKQTVRTVKDPDITECAFGVSFSNHAGENLLKKRYGSFAERFDSPDYSVIGMWKDPDGIPARWKRPEWWTIRTTHFHADPDYVCSCYADV